VLVWFCNKVDLYAVLDQWCDEESNYELDQAVDKSWNVDGFEIALGKSDENSVFERAVQRLFHYDVYPDSVLEFVADFVRDDRLPQTGDRIVERIRVIPGIVDAVTMNIVTAVWREPDHHGFTMVTSERQYEMGEWTASISRKPDGEIAFVMNIISKPSHRLPAFAHGFARRLQKRAHRLALESFASAVREK
jgi:uncharacterized protein (UPF0548 family)